jgi:hypothetical protein
MLCGNDSSRITTFITTMQSIDQIISWIELYLLISIGLRYAKEWEENSIQGISIIHSLFLPEKGGFH